MVVMTMTMTRRTSPTTSSEVAQDWIVIPDWMGMMASPGPRTGGRNISGPKHCVCVWLCLVVLCLVVVFGLYVGCVLLLLLLLIEGWGRFVFDCVLLCLGCVWLCFVAFRVCGAG